MAFGNLADPDGTNFDNMASIQAAKQTLRKEIKKRLRALTDAEKQRQSNIVTDMFLKTQQYQQSQRISIFLSMSDEVQTFRILQHMFSANKTCYIPRYVGPKMDMIRLHSMADYESLPETSWHIKQPPDDEVREDALETGGLDLVLMPGLGFTRQGDRLGRGKGYYDSYLTKCCEMFGRMPATVALAYNEQICETVPTSDHDRQIDVVLFENMDKL